LKARFYPNVVIIEEGLRLKHFFISIFKLFKTFLLSEVVCPHFLLTSFCLRCEVWTENEILVVYSVQRVQEKTTVHFKILL